MFLSTCWGVAVSQGSIGNLAKEGVPFELAEKYRNQLHKVLEPNLKDSKIYPDPLWKNRFPIILVVAFVLSAHFRTKFTRFCNSWFVLRQQETGLQFTLKPFSWHFFSLYFQEAGWSHLSSFPGQLDFELLLHLGLSFVRAPLWRPLAAPGCVHGAVAAWTLGPGVVGASGGATDAHQIPGWIEGFLGKLLWNLKMYSKTWLDHVWFRDSFQLNWDDMFKDGLNMFQ